MRSPDKMRQDKIMIIKCCSRGGNGGKGKISVNGIPIEMYQNESGHWRGIHIVIINPNNG